MKLLTDANILEKNKTHTHTTNLFLHTSRRFIHFLIRPDAHIQNRIDNYSKKKIFTYTN
jgi:hypothetical protein